MFVLSQLRHLNAEIGRKPAFKCISCFSWNETIQIDRKNDLSMKIIRSNVFGKRKIACFLLRIRLVAIEWKKAFYIKRSGKSLFFREKQWKGRFKKTDCQITTQFVFDYRDSKNLRREVEKFTRQPTLKELFSVLLRRSRQRDRVRCYGHAQYEADADG